MAHSENDEKYQIEMEKVSEKNLDNSDDERPQTSNRSSSTSEIIQNEDNRSSSNSEIIQNEDDDKYWSNSWDYIVNALGYVVGLGNFWKFPFNIYKYGGGFLIPYTIFCVIFGIPVFTFLVYISQFTGKGPIASFGNCVLLRGLGFSTIWLNLIYIFPYTMIMIWGLKYFVLSFTPEKYFKNKTTVAGKMNTEVYFEQDGFGIGNVNNGLASIGTPKWELILSSLFIYSLLYLFVYHKLRFSAKLLYVTFLIPFILIIILMIQSLIVNKNDIGKYFNKVELDNMEMWVAAIHETIYNLALTTGAIQTLGKYKKLKEDILISSVLICFVDYLVSILSSIAVIAYISNTSLQEKYNLTNAKITDIHLVFVLLPQAIIDLNPPHLTPLWLCILFLILVTLGFDTIVVVFRILMTGILELINSANPRINENIKFYYIGIALFGFLTSIPLSCDGGLYWKYLIDSSIVWCFTFIGFGVNIFSIYLYGGYNIYKDIDCVLEFNEAKIQKVIWKYIGWMYIISWYVISPLVFGIALRYQIENYKLFTLNGKPVPAWVHVLEFMISLSIPLSAIVYIVVIIALNRKRLPNGPNGFIRVIKAIISLDWNKPLWDCDEDRFKDRPRNYGVYNCLH